MGYKIAGPPTIAKEIFRRALANRRSPALPLSDEAYDVCVGWGVNPAVALAFFVHESQAGTTGYARATKNWGNLRQGPGQRFNDGKFAYYVSWLVGLNDFCKLLRGSLYEGSGLRSVSQVLPRYAPTADNNNPQGYARAVNQMCEIWERLSGLGSVAQIIHRKEA